MTDIAVKGWCPGALRPMDSGDGLIVRLKISGGIVDIALAAEIARWSALWGNGQIDLTSRANLQLRGISAETLPFLQDALIEYRLLDRTPDGEAVRNVISSPLAGLDPDAVLDVRPIAKSLEDRLACDMSLHELPAKFGFLIDDGGRFTLDRTPADIRFEACRESGQPAFDVHLDGTNDVTLGPCQPDTVADMAAILGRVFLRHRDPSIRRMRDLVTNLGTERIARKAGLVHRFSSRSGMCETDPPHFLNAQPLGSSAFVGVGLEFGRIAAADFAALAMVAADHGAETLRLTPWRAILVPLPSISAAQTLSAWLATKPVILSEADPRRRVAACVGAPACPHATTNVRDDALLMAKLIGDSPGMGTLLHVSGCAKGCAHRYPTPIALVGRGGGYDLVRDGLPSDSPLQHALNLNQAIEQLNRALCDHLQGQAT